MNPPVHAWAAWRVYEIEKKHKGVGDRVFLERVFHKLLLNFAWWVNRKDAEGKNIFQGGFLGLDNIGDEHIELRNREDGFFYDVLHLPDGRNFPLKVRSMVGLILLFAVETLDSELVDRLPRFKHRMQWFIENRPDFVAHVETQGLDGSVRRFLSLVNRRQLQKVLRYMLDEQEFLSPYGIRALSRYHQDHPYTLSVMGVEHRVDYEPAESATGLFGRHSNWRGPIWLPQKFYYWAMASR